MSLLAEQHPEHNQCREPQLEENHRNFLYYIIAAIKLSTNTQMTALP